MYLSKFSAILIYILVSGILYLLVRKVRYHHGTRMPSNASRVLGYSERIGKQWLQVEYEGNATLLIAVMKGFIPIVLTASST